MSELRFTIDEEPTRVSPGLRAPLLTIDEPLPDLSIAEESLRAVPDEEVKTRQLEQETGVPRAVIEDDKPAFQRQSQRTKMEEETASSPVTRRFLSDPENMAVAHDDVPDLLSFETLINSVRAFHGNVIEYPGRVLEGAGDIYRSVGDAMFNLPIAGLRALGANYLADALHVPIPWYLDPSEIIKRPGTVIRAGGKFVQPSPEDANFVTDVAGGAGQMAAQIVTAVLSGGLTTGVSIGSLFAVGASQQADAIKAAEEKGAKPSDVDKATAILAGASITAITERFGLDRILNKIPNNMRSKIFQILEGAGTEGAQEIVEAIMQNFVTLGLIDKDQLLVEPSVGREGAVGATVGGLIQLAIPGRQRTRKVLDEANEAALKSKLAVRLDTLAADFREKVVVEGDVGKVFLPAKEVNKFAQSHPQGAPAGYLALGITGPMEVVDGEVEIDSASFARNVLGSENYDKLAPHIRMEHDQSLLPVEATLVAQAAEVDQAIDQNEDTPEGTREATKALVAEFSKGGSIDVVELLSGAPTAVQEALDTAVAQVQAATEADVSDTVLTGRERVLDKQISALDAQIETQSNLIAEKQEAGKAIKRETGKLNTLIAKRDKAITEQTEVGDIALSRRALGAKPAETTARVGKKPIDIRADKLTELSVKTQAEAVRAVRKGFREGARLAKNNIKEAQRALVKLINGSPLRAADKAKFIATIRDTDTVAKLEKKLPEIQSRVTNLIEAERKRELGRALKKTLRKARTKIRDGKLQGKFTPEISKQLDALRHAMETTKDEAASILSNRLGGTTDMPPTIQKLENQILMFKANRDLVDSGDLEATLLGVNQLVEEGKALGKQNRLMKADRERDARERTLALLPENAKPNSKLKQGALDAETAVLGSNGNWEVKLRRMFTGTKEQVDSLVEEFLLFNESRAFDQGKIDMTEKWTKSLQKAMGKGTTERQLLIKMQQDMDEQVEVGTFTHSDEVSRTIVMSRAQLRKRVMELRDPDLEELLRDENSNAYTDEIIDALKAQLSETDHRMVEAQLEFYNDYYERINKAYEKAYGVSLPKLDSYSPITRESSSSEPDEFMKTILYRGGVSPGSLKSRKPSIRKLLPQDDFMVLQSHMLEMEYFIAFHEKVNFLNNVFNGEGAAVISRIRTIQGGNFAQIIQSDLDHFAKRAVRVKGALEKTLVGLLRNFSFAQLGAKPQIGLKQLASFTALAEDVNTAHFTAGLVQFAANPKAALRLLNKSSYFKNRGINIDQDFTDITSSQGGNKLTNFMGRNPNFTKIIMLPIRFGDKGAIAIGGFAHVKAQMKAGMSEADALKSFERLANRTQQSTDPDQLSQMQRDSAFGRVMSQFLSSANALARAEYQAIVEFSKGRMTKSEFSKRMLVYHVIIPNTIMYIANGFNWDDEDQMRATILGALNGVFVFGAVVETALSLTTEDDVRDLEVRHPLGFMADLALAAEDYAQNDITWEDFVEGSRAIDRASRAAGALTGIPFATLQNQMRGFTKLADGDTKQGAALMLGWSPYVIDKQDIGN